MYYSQLLLQRNRLNNREVSAVLTIGTDVLDLERLNQAAYHAGDAAYLNALGCKTHLAV